MSYLYIKDSLTHGKGVFAKCLISPGRFLGLFLGDEVDEPTTHSLTIAGRHIQPANDCLLRFLNHSITRRHLPQLKLYVDLIDSYYGGDFMEID